MVTPSGKKSTEEALFGWIVSDFGLNDAIESGLVKTPRVVVRDDALPAARTYKSRLYHIYSDPDVRDDLNRRAQPKEPLPDLVMNAYYLLGFDWRETMEAWRKSGLSTSPVMITVCNRTETAARVKHAFDARRIHIDELCDPDRVLHIDSKVLDQAESQEEPVAAPGMQEDEPEADEDDGPTVERRLTRAEQAELLRRTVDTVGKPGQPGEKIQNVISVGMLSEGWDAKTVTHIMGLRAFSSQLLCEQVVGRGLRRTAYEVNPETRLFDAEYVNIFEAARDVFDQMEHTWKGSREVLLAQLVKIVEGFIRSDKITISPPLFYQDELWRRLILTLNMSAVVQHIQDAVRQENTERLMLVFDRDRPIRSTGDMRAWYTGKPCERTRRSHINVCVYDSTWEASDAFALDDSSAVAAWAKNDHLGFEVQYIYRGVVRKYRPDFLVRLKNGAFLVLETKGQHTEQDKVKRRYLDEWIQAVNAHGGFGRWRAAVASNPGKIRDILKGLEKEAKG